MSVDEAATVLLADLQTTGGYPKIATILSSDLDRMVQARPGQMLRFAAVSPDEAIVRADAAERADYLARVSIARGTLGQRFVRENLNHGVIDD